MPSVGSQKKLIMIMGIQRSGGTTFLRSFLRDSSVTALKQEIHSAVYRNTHMRPVDQTSDYLTGLHGTVIIEPKSESKFRRVTDVFDEYRDFDLWMLWNYSDPMSVYYRRILRYPHKNTEERLDRFIKMWNSRNQKVLDALAQHSDHIAIIKLEDVVKDPSVYWRLCGYLGLKGTYRFYSDPADGQRNLPPHVREKILGGTRDVLKALDEKRRFKPRPHYRWGASHRQFLHIRNAVTGGLRQLKRKVHGCL